MQLQTLNSSEQLGSTPQIQPLETIPTGMETDPHADEEVIDNHSKEEYPEPVQPASESVAIAPDDLSDSIAYALDGSATVQQVPRPTCQVTM